MQIYFFLKKGFAELRMWLVGEKAKKYDLIFASTACISCSVCGMTSTLLSFIFCNS